MPGKLKKAIKSVGVRRTANIDSQLSEAMERPDVRAEYRKFKGNPEIFKQGLKRRLEEENFRLGNLRKFGTTLDVVNKATVPVDAYLDAANMAFGAGYALKGLKTAVMSPGYLTYDAYYLGKTGDLLGTLGNIAYELGSWAFPASLPHIITRYSNQADRYAINKSSKKFISHDVKGLEKRVSKSNSIKFKRQSKKDDLEDLAVAA